MSPDRSTRKTALTDPGGDSRLGVVVTQFVQPLAKLVGLPDSISIIVSYKIQ